MSEEPVGRGRWRREIGYRLLDLAGFPDRGDNGKQNLARVGATLGVTQAQHVFAGLRAVRERKPGQAWRELATAVRAGVGTEPVWLALNADKARLRQIWVAHRWVAGYTTVVVPGGHRGTIRPYESADRDLLRSFVAREFADAGRKSDVDKYVTDLVDGETNLVRVAARRDQTWGATWLLRESRGGPLAVPEMGMALGQFPEGGRHRVESALLLDCLRRAHELDVPRVRVTVADPEAPTARALGWMRFLYGYDRDEPATAPTGETYLVMGTTPTRGDRAPSTARGIRLFGRPPRQRPDGGDRGSPTR